MTTDSTLPDERKAKIKAATRKLVTQAGGQESAAQVCRVSGPSLAYYGLPHRDQYIPADAIADLERDVGVPLVTRILAELAGYDLVPRDGAGLSNQDPMHLAVRLDADASAFGTAVADMEEDGRRDAHELDLCLEKAQRVIIRAQNTYDQLYRMRHPKGAKGGEG
jgi:hypothetical protein